MRCFFKTSSSIESSNGEITPHATSTSQKSEIRDIKPEVNGTNLVHVIESKLRIQIRYFREWATYNGNGENVALCKRKVDIQYCDCQTGSRCETACHSPLEVRV